jgi:hypothetical protein
MTALQSPASSPTRPPRRNLALLGVLGELGATRSLLTKAESARINGANSSMNPSSHAITTKTLTLRNQNQDHFLEIMNAYFEYWNPSNQVDLISQTAAALLPLHRIWRYETAILDLEMDAQALDFENRFLTSDEDTRGGLAFLQSRG